MMHVRFSLVAAPVWKPQSVPYMVTAARPAAGQRAACRRGAAR